PLPFKQSNKSSTPCPSPDSSTGALSLTLPSASCDDVDPRDPRSFVSSRPCPLSTPLPCKPVTASFSSLDSAPQVSPPSLPCSLSEEVSPSSSSLVSSPPA
ncbi:unnamed protein product, partial [Ectocarpus sp. 12 AP-2014]